MAKVAKGKNEAGDGAAGNGGVEHEIAIWDSNQAIRGIAQPVIKGGLNEISIAAGGGGAWRDADCSGAEERRVGMERRAHRRMEVLQAVVGEGLTRTEASSERLWGTSIRDDAPRRSQGAAEACSGARGKTH